MSDKMFEFVPALYSEQFTREGYVHIRGGVTESFYRKAVQQVEENMKSKLMKEFAIGDKQQAMYEFPEGGDYTRELCQAVGAVTGLRSEDLVVSERHIKGYEATAAAEPNAHKDRFASEISVGLSVHVKEGSKLVLFPYDECDINPFNTSVQLRASLSPDRYPEPRLKAGRRVEILDQARDVIIFRGHKFWHLRSNPALTTMLYLKMNSFNCDPLGEDPRTEAIRKQTLAAAEYPDEQLRGLVPLIGRRVDFFHRHYNRDWREVIGVVLWGEKHFSIDDDELRFMQAIDSKSPVHAVVAKVDSASESLANLEKVRRLARRGVIDLVAV